MQTLECKFSIEDAIEQFISLLEISIDFNYFGRNYGLIVDKFKSGNENELFILLEDYISLIETSDNHFGRDINILYELQKTAAPQKSSNEIEGV